MPSTNDAPAVSNAHKGATPYSFMPQKPTMMVVTSVSEHTMCEITLLGVMIIYSLRLLIGQEMKQQASPTLVLLQMRMILI